MSDTSKPPASDAAVMHILGEIQGTLKAVHRELERDREDSREARGRMYRRIEEVSGEVAEVREDLEKVENTAILTGQVAAQARDVAEATRKTLNEEVLPQTRRLKAIGWKTAGFVSGMSLAAGLAAAPAYAAVMSTIEKLFGL